MKKMNLRPKANDVLIATLVCLVSTLISSVSQAAVDEPPAVEDYRENNGLVERHYPIEVTASYKERREASAFMVSFDYENVILDRYVSVVDFVTYYQEMFGESEFPVYNINLSYKYNFSLGSLTGNFGMGYGSISDNSTGVAHALTLTKYSLSASYIMDMLFDEPYAAPYLTAGVMRLGLEEKADATTATGNIDVLTHFQVGVLIQLNWMDPSVSKKNINDYGLQNTYLDVFVSKYEPSSDVMDPDTSTDLSIGAGLRLEF